MPLAHLIIPVRYADIPDFQGYRAGIDGSVWICRAVRRFGTPKGQRKSYLSDLAAYPEIDLA